MSDISEDASDGRSEATSGILLIAGSLAILAVMALHPTGHSLSDPDRFAAQARLNVAVHGLALAAVPVLFCGLLGVARRLGRSDLTTAALVAYAYGAAAVISAAVVSGLVAPELIERSFRADAASQRLSHALLDYNFHLNQGFANVNAVASSVAVLLFSAVILRGGRMPRVAGIAGVVVGAGILVGILGGHLRLDVHGFAIVVIAQSAWMIWLGIVLWRTSGMLRSPAR